VIKKRSKTVVETGFSVYLYCILKSVSELQLLSLLP